MCAASTSTRPILAAAYTAPAGCIIENKGVQAIVIENASQPGIVLEFRVIRIVFPIA
jgi:hypothetical protein